MNNLHPGIIILTAGFLSLFLPLKLSRIVNSVGILLGVFAFSFLSESSVLTYHISDYITLELLKIDNLSWAFCLMFLTIALIADIYSWTNKNKYERTASNVYAGAAIGAVLCGDYISLIMFWEVTAIASTFIVWEGGTEESKKASYRYLLMHLFGGNMLLAGAIVIGTSSGYNIEILTDSSSYGYWLMLIGIAVNAAIPPLHTWVPDAYPQASPFGTLYLGSFTTKLAIYALIRMFAGTEWLVITGGIMAVYGVCMALLENDIRKLLSYHIVSQLGMMVAALGTGLDAGIDGAALHAIFNIMYKGVLLMAAGVIFVATGKRKITELSGIARLMPLTSVCFLIGSLAIAGMPFLNGFASKALIMEALREGNFSWSYWLVMIAGVGTWLSVTLKINYFVFLKKTEGETVKIINKVPASMKAGMVAATFLCAITGMFPGPLYLLMPNGTEPHLFTSEHILEYLGLFVGASIPFFLLVKKMKPHDLITLDFDWIYRKPLTYSVIKLSKIVYAIFGRGMALYDKTILKIRILMNNPGKILKSVPLLREDDEDGEMENERPLSEHMSLFIAFLILAFVIVLGII